MSRTTGLLQLFKPQAGVNSDFVDVNADINAQMARIDSVLYPNVVYRVVNQDWSLVPPAAYKSEKIFNLWDNSVRLGDSTVFYPPGINPWEIAESSQEGWILVDPAFFIAPYVSAPTNPVYYRFCQSYPGSAEGIFQFKGRVINTTGFAVIPSLTSIPLMTTPVNANQDTVMQIVAGRGGLIDNDHYQYARMSFATATGQISATRVPCAGNAATQTAGNTNNFFRMDGFTLRGVSF